MELNRGSVATDRLIEMYRSYKTGSCGVAGDAQRLIDYVAEIQEDDELKNDVVGNLNARGTSLQQVAEIIAGAKRIREAILKEYPIVEETQE